MENMERNRHRHPWLKRLGFFCVILWLVLLAAGGLSSSLAESTGGGGAPVAIDKGESAASKEKAPEAGGLKAIIQKKAGEEIGLASRLTSLLGLAVLLGLAFLMSRSRRDVRWGLVAWGVGLQLIFAVLILKTYPGQWVFQKLTDAVNVLLGFTEEGSRFIFGNLVFNNVPVGLPLGDTKMGPVFFDTAESFANTGAFFAFNVLPVIIFFSSLMSILYHFGVMQHFVRAFAWVMRRTMKTSGAETLSASANIFVGQTEAPLMIRPYVEKMTESELMAVMSAGFATIAGSVLAAYVGMLRHIFPDIAGHLIAASVMSAPAALVIAKMMVPETEHSLTADGVELKVEKTAANAIDAAANGASVGLKLALNVGAMLLAFISLIALINYLIGMAGGLAGLEGLTFQKILGLAFWPIAWVMGIPAADCSIAGQLLGEKIVLNEFVAYLHLADILTQSSHELSYRSMVILTYALCGFANFGSIAIQLGGIGGLAPSRRGDLAKLGLRAMIAGNIAAFMTATVAGLLI